MTRRTINRRNRSREGNYDLNEGERERDEGGLLGLRPRRTGRSLANRRRDRSEIDGAAAGK